MKKNREEIIAEVGNIKKPIHIQLKYSTIFRLEEFMETEHIDSFSKAIEQLITMSLILNEHKDKIGDHELLSEIENQFKEGGLVDYFEKMNPSDFKILHSIIDNEYSSRTKKPIKK